MSSVSRPLRPGDLIVSSEPFVYILSTKDWGKRCHSCLKQSDSLKRCGGCHTFAYCGKDCQVKDWSDFHKLGECKYYKRMRYLNLIQTVLEQDSESGITLTLRTYLLCKKRPDVMDKEYTLADGRTRTFRDVVTNEETVTEMSANGLNTIRLIVRRYFEPHVPDLDVDFIVKCVLRIDANAFRVYDVNTMHSPGVGLYVEASVFDKSCRPNAVATNIGTKLFVRAIREIPAGDQIYVTREVLAKPRALRLKRQNGVPTTCQCERCLAGDPPDSEEKWKELNRLYGELYSTGCRRRFRGTDADEEQRIADQKADARLMFELQKKVCELHEQMIGIPFYFCLTVKLLDVVSAGMHVDQTADDTQYLRQLVSKTREHMLVTHGPDHPILQILKERIDVIEGKTTIDFDEWLFNDRSIF